MASSGELRSMLGPAIFNSIPSNAQVVLEQAWTSQTDTLRTQLEKVRVDSEQKVAELTAANTELTSKLAVYSEETERGQNSLQTYREQASVRFIFIPNEMLMPICIDQYRAFRQTPSDLRVKINLDSFLLAALK